VFVLRAGDLTPVMDFSFAINPAGSLFAVSFILHSLQTNK
jgi:hypothetical protein